MKKFLVITVLALFLALPVMAATNDFTADANVNVTLVTFGDTTAEMLIMNGSTAQSWAFSGGIFTVTNPGTFKVGTAAAETTVTSIKVKNSGGSVIACANNTTAGISYVTLPTASATYTVVPSTTENCATLCTTQTGAATYYVNDGTYTLPTCGVLTCSSPYTLSAATASVSTSCNPPSVANGGGGGTPSATPTETPATPTETPATPATPSETPATPATPATPSSAATQAAEQIKNIVAEAATMAGRDTASVLAAVGAMQDAKAEAAAEKKYTAPLVSGLKNVTAEVKSAITNFVNYGTPTTKILGAGERAGVVNSYKSTFGKLPATAEEWSDVIKIANGRWPTARDAKSENASTDAFKKIYKRAPDRSNQHDDAAVTVIAYGLRPGNRNLNSERAAIKSFKAVYGYAPKSAMAWDIVRAIAYSGAKR